MTIRRIQRLALVALASLATATPVLGQGSWADAIVQTRKLDFGVIATGSEAVKLVEIENTTGATVHISSTSTACRCAEASPPAKALLHPGEKTTIEVRMNTRSFKQQRDTTLTILFDSPQFAEVRIPISAYIRTDVVFEPGKVDFGRVEFLAGKEIPVQIAYSGRPDWRILDVKITNQRLTATLKETRREPGQLGYAVGYELVMKLSKEARPGRFRDIITLVTDDAANPNVPLLVEGEVVPDISISNPSIAIRALKPGETTTVKLVVKGTRPFLIEDVDCKDLQNCFEVKLSETENKVQVVELQFTAPDEPGKFSEQMVVKIKGRDESIPFAVSGVITN
jgi:hypothetical protein